MINKSFCEDLTEGKFSFPIIHSLQTNKNDNRLLNIHFQSFIFIFILILLLIFRNIKTKNRRY